MPASSSRRLIAFIIGIAFIIWLPIEDTSIWQVMLLSISFCFLVATYWVARIPGHTKLRDLLKLSMLGTVLGLGAIGIAIFLMAFKSGLHAHGFADFTPRQVTTVLRLTPWTISLGILLSIGMGLINARNRS